MYNFINFLENFMKDVIDTIETGLDNISANIQKALLNFKLTKEQAEEGFKIAASQFTYDPLPIPTDKQLNRALNAAMATIHVENTKDSIKNGDIANAVRDIATAVYYSTILSYE
jgi:hypothetical protein